MDLKNYINKNYKNPNPKVLEALGASQTLIDYLRFTPWNTNKNMLDSLGVSGGSAAVVGTAIVGTAVVGGGTTPGGGVKKLYYDDNVSNHLSAKSDFSSINEAFGYIENNYNAINKTIDNFEIWLVTPNQDIKCQITTITHFDGPSTYNIYDDSSHVFMIKQDSLTCTIDE